MYSIQKNNKAILSFEHEEAWSTTILDDRYTQLDG